MLLAGDHYELRDVTAKLLTAESRITATVPRASGEPIAIEVSLTAPDVSELRAGLPPLRLASSFKAAIAAERIDVDPLTIELGDSDFSGAGSVVLGDVMAIEIKGQSKLIELTPFQPAPPPADDTNAAASNASASQPHADSAPADAASEWVFVEEELPFERLRSLDLSAEVAADEVRSRDARAQNFKLALNGEGGTYDVRASFDVAEGGAAEGHFVFDAAGDTAEVTLELAANGLLLNIASGEVDDPSQIPPLGFLATVRSKGDSPRALASVANGRLILTQGAGRIDNTTVGLASGDILAQIFSALNPFAKDEQYSKWDCTVVALSVTDGIGELEPMLAQAEKLLIVGHGTVDLKTEKLDIEFNTKPRTGVGVTADMFVTPFVKLSGTLGKPGVGMNASGTLLAGGAAALTGGMSLVVRGLADRATAEADQCAEAARGARGAVDAQPRSVGTGKLDDLPVVLDEADRPREARAHVGLQHVARDVEMVGIDLVLLVVRGRQHEHDRVAIVLALPDLPQQLDAVHPRHVDVGDDEVRPRQRRPASPRLRRRRAQSRAGSRS